MSEVSSHTSSKGFVFVVFGESFAKEAAESARQIRRFHDYPIMLITDRPIVDSKIVEVFSQVAIRSFKREYSDKILMRESPYEMTIFLDSDTLVLGSMDPVFDLLEHFDLALQYQSPVDHYDQPGIPVSFHEPSAGIIAWKQSPAMSRLFDDWSSVYNQIQHDEGRVGAWDQRSLRHALYFRHDVRFVALPIEWQFYIYWPNVVVGPVKMVHGRGVTEEMVRSINASSECRVWLPKLGCVPQYLKSSIPEMITFIIKYGLLVLRVCARRMLAAVKILPFPVNQRPA